MYRDNFDIESTSFGPVSRWLISAESIPSSSGTSKRCLSDVHRAPLDDISIFFWLTGKFVGRHFDVSPTTFPLGVSSTAGQLSCKGKYQAVCQTCQNAKIPGSVYETGNPLWTKTKFQVICACFGYVILRTKRTLSDVRQRFRPL